MPKLEITCPEGTLPTEAKAKLPGELAAALLRWEGAPDTAFFRSISWAHLRELPAEAIQTPDGVADPHFVVDVTVPKGALSERRKEGLIGEATKLICEATGWEQADAFRIWVIVHEVPDGNWGGAGQVIRFEQLREAAKAERRRGDNGMKELTFVEPEKVEWREAAAPAIEGDGEAIVRPVAVATCDLDTAVIAGLVPVKAPFALGHECIAEVTEVGDRVESFSPGELVSVPFRSPAGSARPAGRGGPAAA